MLYLHDAATVLYPFAFEPLASLVQQSHVEPLAYRDLGLPPLGATARRFADPALQDDAVLCDLEEIPAGGPGALLHEVVSGTDHRIGSTLTRKPMDGVARTRSESKISARLNRLGMCLGGADA